MPLSTLGLHPVNGGSVCFLAWNRAPQEGPEGVGQGVEEKTAFLVDGGWSCTKQVQAAVPGWTPAGATHGPLTVEPPVSELVTAQEPVGPCGVRDV